MKKLLSTLGCLAIAMTVFAQDIYTVQTKKVIAKVPSTLWGLFFEDINRGADGGLYAELVKNRSFDFPKPMTGWSTWPERIRDGVFVIQNQYSENAINPKFLSVTTMTKDTVGLTNSGFGGMVFKKGLAYKFTFRFQQIIEGVNVTVYLLGNQNRRLDKKELVLKKGSDWQEQQLTLNPNDSSGHGILIVLFRGKGKINVDRISLFPTDTWNKRANGLRADLVQKLVDMHPGFLRFPGGCIVEGKQLTERYQWKNTIGPLENRKLIQNYWADDISQRPMPDYMESFGLGFYEYFTLCEDIGAEPLPMVNAGMSCQFEAAEVAPINEIQPYIQDALDLIEFANGDVRTTWGAKRATLGHPAPFDMKMIGVGNENWGPQYAERLDLFTKAIKTKYPKIQIVNATGYSRNKPVFSYMDSVLRARHADIIDEHFYDSPKWFMDNAGRYDNYDRKGPKIFVGEYAAQSDHVGSQKNVNSLITALGEACFMSGIERNADVVTMASYAPLFAHVDDWQWTPNLIWFNNNSSYNTPNYYVQELFSVNKGKEVVPILKDNKPVSGQDSCWASAVTENDELIIKMINMNSNSTPKSIYLSDANAIGTGSITSIYNTNVNVVNTLGTPTEIKPKTSVFPVKGRIIHFTAPAYSFNVIRIKLKQ